MRIAMISDLHLAPGARSRCTTSPARLVQCIDALSARADRVLLVGDTFDLLRPRRPRGWRAELERMEETHPDLMATLGRCQKLVGNHDYPLRARGVPEEVTIVGRALTACLIHGHQWDVWLKKLWGLEESANFIAGWFERAGLDVISTWMSDVPAMIQELTLMASAEAPEEGQQGEAAALFPGEGSLTWRGVRGEFARGFDVIALGHTHGLGLGVVELTDRTGLIINTGSHAHGHEDAAMLDLELGLAWTIRDEEVLQVASYDERTRRWRVEARGEEGFDEALAKAS